MKCQSDPLKYFWQRWKKCKKSIDYAWTSKWLDAGIWLKNHQISPKIGVFPSLWNPKILCQKSVSVTFVLVWCPNFMQKIKKTDELPLRYPKILNKASPNISPPEYKPPPNISPLLTNTNFLMKLTTPTVSTSKSK